MADDIVTLLRMPICGNYDDDHLSWGPQPCSSCVEAADEIERLRAIVKDLHHHLGEALYSDEWKTREYAIASHSRYDKEPI